MTAGIRDIVLWRTLVPENDGQYAGVFLAVILTGVITTALRMVRNGWEGLERMSAAKVRVSSFAHNTSTVAQAAAWQCRHLVHAWQYTVHAAGSDIPGRTGIYIHRRCC